MSNSVRATADNKLPAKPAESYFGRIKRLHKKAARKRLTHYSLLAANVLLLLVVAVFVARSSSGDGSALQGVPATANAIAAKADDIVDPLDQLSSADIAVNVARSANLPEERAVTNQADSQNVELAVAQSAGGLVSKPQVVAVDLKSYKDIKTYVAQAGDTAGSVGAKFGVTSDSIMWSNDLASEAIAAGQTLYIPPVNGIVYVVKGGDTPESLAAKFRASKEKIIASNDAELAGLAVGSRILIPEGRIVREVAAPAYRASSGGSFPWGGGPVYNGANGYDFGYCTWYVANRISVPSNWGNANTWDNLAPRSGWVVSTAPRVGAIAQTDRGYFGHVAVVTAVSEDGTQIKYADMNGIAGWGREGFSDWTSVSRFEHYISR